MIPIKGTINNNLPSHATANSFSSTLGSNKLTDLVESTPKPKMNSSERSVDKLIFNSDDDSVKFVNTPKNYKYILDDEDDFSNGDTILQKNIFIDFSNQPTTMDETEEASDETFENIDQILQNLKNGKSITVFLCLYSVDTSCYVENVLSNLPSLTFSSSESLSFPFAKYLLKNNTFPFFLFNRENFTESTNINIEFETECIKQLSEIITNIHDLNVEKITDLYKGVYIEDYSAIFSKEDDKYSEVENKKISKTKCNSNVKNEEPKIYAFFDLSSLTREKFGIIKTFSDVSRMEEHEIYSESERRFFSNKIIFNNSGDSGNLDNLSSKSTPATANWSFPTLRSGEFLTINKDLYWVTIDEIIYKKKINNLDIDDDVINLFYRENKFKTIHSLEDQAFPIPFQLYLCKSENLSSQSTANWSFSSLTSSDKSINSSESITDPNYKNNLSNTVIGEPIEPYEHPILGYGYYFTSEPLPNTVDVTKLQRFSCFIVNCFYMFNLSKTPFSGLEHEQNELHQPSTKDGYFSSIYSKESANVPSQKTANWLSTTFRSEDPLNNSVNDDDIIKTSSTFLRTSEDGKYSEVEKDNNEILENILSSPSIYFNENGIQYWCIRNISHFTKI
jgi:hypothetical protein